MMELVLIDRVDVGEMSVVSKEGVGELEAAEFGTAVTGKCVSQD